jgi:arylsulfatase A-like enzyme
MPTVESLAITDSGTTSSTTALCSPTHSALLSGRHHHMNNFGSIAETATAFPGQEKPF